MGAFGIGIRGSTNSKIYPRRKFFGERHCFGIGLTVGNVFKYFILTYSIQAKIWFAEIIVKRFVSNGIRHYIAIFI